LETFRKKLVELFDLNPIEDPLLRQIERTFYVLILVSTVAVILETFPHIDARFNFSLEVLESFVTIIFLIELILRLWTLKEVFGQHPTRWDRFLILFYLFIDALAVVPALVFALLGNHHDYFLTFRLLRMFKAFRHDHSVELVLKAILRKRQELLRSAILVLISAVFLSVVLYEAEHNFELGDPKKLAKLEQKTPFKDIYSTLTWTFSFFVGDPAGYQENDMSPITPTGRGVAMLIGLLNIAVLVIPTAIIASGFIEAVEEEQLTSSYSRLKEAFRPKYNEVLEIPVYERPRTVMTVQNALNIYENQLYKIVALQDGFRVRSVQSAEDEKYNDTNLLEFFGYGRLTPYGVHMPQETPGFKSLVVCPRSESQVGIGYFAYCTAALLQKPLLSNERFQKHALAANLDMDFWDTDYLVEPPPGLRPSSKEYRKLPIKTRALFAFKKDIRHYIAQGISRVVIIDYSTELGEQPFAIEPCFDDPRPLAVWLRSQNLLVTKLLVNVKTLEQYSYLRYIREASEALRAYWKTYEQKPPEPLAPKTTRKPNNRRKPRNGQK
jgi:voltage-gated potassium channel